MNAYAAMRYTGVDRNYLRSLSKADRLRAWVMMLMTLDLTLNT